MKIIIAGGLGYIGTALWEYYRGQSKYEIIVVDKRFIPERVINIPKNMRFIKADIQDLDLMRYLMKDVNILYLHERLQRL